MEYKVVLISEKLGPLLHFGDDDGLDGGGPYVVQDLQVDLCWWCSLVFFVATLCQPQDRRSAFLRVGPVPDLDVTPPGFTATLFYLSCPSTLFPQPSAMRRRLSDDIDPPTAYASAASSNDLASSPWRVAPRAALSLQ